jgi:hypothetical protein
MRPLDSPDPSPTPSRNPVGSDNGSGLDPTLPDLTIQAFQLRSQHRYALHPIEAALQYHRAHAEIPGEEGHGGCGFEEAEAHYRAGAQGIRLPEIPQLAQQLRELSRLGPVDRAGRKSLRKWAEEHGHVFDEDRFLRHWIDQGKRGGAEHQVYYDPKSKDLAPVVSQPHVEVDTSRPLVTKSETDDLMATMGFAPVQLIHDGIRDDGYYAYLHPVTGVLAYDLHDENVVRIPETDDLAIIDPYISLARLGTWTAIKLAEVGYPTPPDDPSPEFPPSAS